MRYFLITGGYERRGTTRRDFGSGGFRDSERFRDSYGDKERGYDNRDSYGDRGRFGGDKDGYGERERFPNRRGGDRDRDFGSRSGFGPRRTYGPGSDYEREGGGGSGGGGGGGFRGRDDRPPEKGNDYRTFDFVCVCVCW